MQNTQQQEQDIPKTIHPVSTGSLQLQAHKFEMFGCEVQPGLSKAELEDPKLWANVTGKLRAGSEIRAVASDGSFVAYLFVKYVNGSDIRIQVMHGYELEKVEVKVTEGDYTVENRQGHGWCVIKRDTGEIIKSNLANQSSAYRELEDYERALKR